MFSSNRIHGYYFLKDHGVIICTSPPIIEPTQNRLFLELQENVKNSLRPLINLIEKAYEEQLEEYTEAGGKLSSIPSNHSASILLNLKCILESSEKFFGKYKPRLPDNAVVTNNPSNSIDTWAQALAELTHVDCKEAYKLLLKINACKKQYHYVNEGMHKLPITDNFIPYKSEGEDGYKKGLQEITSFENFLKKIEKSIAYLQIKSNQEETQDQSNKKRIKI